MKNDLQVLKEWLSNKYDLVFQQEKYLIEAITHSSYANEHKEMNGIYNERIEFLGDAVLELFVSNWLYRHLPHYNEGQLTRLRAQIVCEESLSQLAIECNLNHFLLLGRGEKSTGGASKPAILCDVFEAFVGAIYLDKGFEEVSRFLNQVIISKIKDGKFLLANDYKTQLQEYFQQDGSVCIRYTLLAEEGPSHEKIFTVQVSVNDQPYAIGVGKSKKAAEQMAAKKTLTELNVID